MNAPDFPSSLISDSEPGRELPRLMDAIGLKAKASSVQIARAPAAIKNRALSGLAALLRQAVQALQVANQRLRKIKKI